jgi:hypothetical protein
MEEPRTGRAELRAHLPPLARALVAVLAAITVDTAVADSSTPRLAAYYDRHMAICGGEAYEWSGDDPPRNVGRDVLQLATAAKAASVGDGTNYYVTADGELFARGDAHRGQYGDGRLEPAPTAALR